MDAVRTLIAGDDVGAVRHMARLLEQMPAFRLIGEARSSQEALEIIPVEKPDLLLVDVQTTDHDGFEGLRSIDPKERPTTIFVAALEQHAVRAFELEAVDCLLKPFCNDRFFAALRRACEHVESRRLRAGRAAAPPAENVASGDPAGAHGPRVNGRTLSRLLIRIGDRRSFVDVNDVDWISGADYYAKLHVAGRTYLLRRSLTELSRRLDSSRFVRVHRSAIVNLERVREIQPYFNGQFVLILRDATRVTVSRRRRRVLEHAIGEKL